mgnify:FL=1
MQRIKKHVITGMLLFFGSHGANIAADPRTVIIAIDVSKSNAAISDEVFAERAARYIKQPISELGRFDTVRVRTFGDYGMQANPLRLDLDVSRRTPASKIAETAETLIKSLPSLVASGRLQAANTTQISAFLADEARTLSCWKRNTTIYLLSDGIEASAQTDPDRLRAGQAALPSPKEGVLKGCTIQMLGIGETASGANPVQTQALINAWSEWAEKAGAHFVPKPSF